MFSNLRRASSSWVWLLTLFTVAGFIEVVFWSQMQAFTPIYLRALGIKGDQDIKTWTGAIAAVSSAIGLPFLPLWGALADRYARQPVIVRSYVAHLLGGICALLAPNIWLFVIGRSIMSFALGNTGLMMTTLSERAPKERMGLAFSIMNGAPPIGVFLGPLIGGPIVDVWGFHTLLIIDVGLMVLVILAMSFGYRDAYKATAQGPLLGLALGSIGLIWRSPRLRVLFPALFLLFGGWMLAFTYVPIAIGQLYHGSDLGSAIGYVVGGGGLTTLVLSPIFGGLADRFGYWRVTFIGAAISVALWPLPFLAPDLLTFALAWAAANGVTSSLFALSFTVLSNSTPPAIRGRVMTFSYLPVNLGYTVGPAIGGVIAQGNVFAVFPAAAVMTVFSIGALAIAARTKAEPEERSVQQAA